MLAGYSSIHFVSQAAKRSPDPLTPFSNSIKIERNTFVHSIAKHLHGHFCPIS